MACAYCQASYSNMFTKIIFSFVFLKLFGKNNLQALWYLFFKNIRGGAP